MFLQGIKEESMKAKNKLLTLLILSAGAAVTTAGINKAIQFSAISKNFLAEPEPLCCLFMIWTPVHPDMSGNSLFLF